MMLTPRCPRAGPTGGLGFACPAGICSLISAMAFFAMVCSGLFDLHEVELDGGGAREDADQHAQLPLVRLAEPADTLLEGRLHLVLVAGVRVHHVPAPLLLCRHDLSLSAH